VVTEYTVADTSSGFYEDRRSEFTAVLRPTESIDGFMEYVDSLRKKHSGMCHFCIAIRLRNPTLTEKASDDGEPNGTAGKPILQSLQRKNLMGCGIVVYRKYGGTKLGTGGLVKAYGTSARLAIENATIGRMIELKTVSFNTDYSLWSKLETHIKTFDSNPQLNYTDKISVLLSIEPDKIESLERIIAEMSAGSIKLNIGESTYRFRPEED